MTAPLLTSWARHLGRSMRAPALTRAQQAEIERRDAEITMAIEALAGWPFADVCAFVARLLADRADYCPDAAEALANRIGRQAHHAGRACRGVAAARAAE